LWLDEGRGLFFDRPGRREAAGGHGWRHRISDLDPPVIAAIVFIALGTLIVHQTMSWWLASATLH
jgi:hypothetical protein